VNGEDATNDPAWHPNQPDGGTSGGQNCADVAYWNRVLKVDNIQCNNGRACVCERAI